MPSRENPYEVAREAYRAKISKKAKDARDGAISRLPAEAATAWKAFVTASEGAKPCGICGDVLTPHDKAAFEFLRSTGRAAEGGRNSCPCINNCHVTCLLIAMPHVWRSPSHEFDADTGIVTEGTAYLKRSNERSHGAYAMDECTVLQFACPKGHSNAIIMPVMTTERSFGSGIDETQNVFEFVSKP